MKILCLNIFYNKTFFSIFRLLFVILNLVNGDEDSPSVIIVGAGASGIAAASKLFQNGFKNITILEAEDRIGGRVYTTQFEGYWVDIGGQWVQGEDGNEAYDLAWPLGLLEKTWITKRPCELFDSSGKEIDQTSSDIMKTYSNIIENLSESSEKANGSIGDYFTNELNKYFETHPNWNESSKEILHLFNIFQMSDDAGDTWWDVSIRTRFEYHDFPGDSLINWKERGYSTILDILMKRYPNPEEELPVLKNTVLNAEVSLINNKESDEKVKVTTTNGDTYFANHVIVTPSLGVLKEKYCTLFQPPLPEEKIRTIKGLGFGNIAKIYLAFEEPWWKTNTTATGFTFLWKEDDIEQLENDAEKSWLPGLVGFNFVEHKPRLLCGWVGGKYTREMEKMSEQQVFNQSVEALRRFLGNSYNISTPTGMMRTTWSMNEHFKGTYSFRAMKSDADNVWHATLAEPIGVKKPTVLFAGEATSSHHFGTVNGAIESGQREANRLIKLYPNLASVQATPSNT